jgi:uncharacterized phiE125 gp8 family phage protein
MQEYECHSHLELVEPSLTEPLVAATVLSDHLRSPNGTAETDYVTALIKVARRMAERTTRRALMRQTWRLVLDRFPVGLCPMVIPRPPLVGIERIEYLDVDGVTQEWGGSPAPYDVSAPIGPAATPARVRPVYGTCWPVARCQMDAVTVTFTAGYPENQIPEDILHGMLLVIAELYKQRSLSVHAPNQNKALIQAENLWAAYRIA